MIGLALNQINSLATHLTFSMNETDESRSLDVLGSWNLSHCHGFILASKADRIETQLLRLNTQEKKVYAGKENIYPVDMGFSIENLNFLGESCRLLPNV